MVLLFASTTILVYIENRHVGYRYQNKYEYTTHV